MSVQTSNTEITSYIQNKDMSVQSCVVVVDNSPFNIRGFQVVITDLPHDFGYVVSVTSPVRFAKLVGSLDCPSLKKQLLQDLFPNPTYADAIMEGVNYMAGLRKTKRSKK
jgi:hypothetical protein